MNPLLSIVIPYLNRASFLPETLRSVDAAVTNDDVVLILVDNGSTDGSDEVCASFAAQNSNPHLSILLTDEQRRGAAFARNKGLSLCQTPFVYFFDSDDLFDQNFVRTVSPLLHAVDADLLALTSRMEVNGRSRIRTFRPVADPAAQIVISHLNTVSMLFRTAFLRSIGGWNERLTTWDDWELGVRALLAAKQVQWFTQRPFHLARVHADSQTGPGFSSRFDAERTALRTVTRLVSSCPQQTRAQRAVYLRYAALMGSLKREKSHDACLQLQTDIRQLFPHPSFAERTMFRFLSFYVSNGWRGWWQFALRFLPRL